MARLYSPLKKVNHSYTNLKKFQNPQERKQGNNPPCITLQELSWPIASPVDARLTKINWDLVG